MAKIVINNLNLGGIAESKYAGRANSVAKMVGLDVHSEPGVVKVHQKLKKESGAIVDALVKCSVVCSDGNTFFFSSSSGKVWKRTSAGVWSLAYTTVPTSGGAGCLGAAECGGYIYWATARYIHRIDVDDTADWTSNADLNWQLMSASGDTEYHPMVVQNLVLYIGDRNYVHQVESGSYSAEALDLPEPNRVKCLSSFDTDLLIGTTVDGNINKATIYRWNTWSVSWSVEDSVDEVGINAFIPVDNHVFVQAGLSGNIYYYNGSTLEMYQQIPGTYSSTQYGSVNPNATASFKGMPLFGFSNGTGNPTEEGVYSLATKNPALYPRVLGLDYVISQDKVAGVEIGNIAVVGNIFLVSWKEGANYGVDVLDVSNKYDGAYLESRVVMVERERQKSFSELAVSYVDLPDDTDIEVYIKQDYADAWGDEITMVNDTDRQRFISTDTPDAFVLQIKVVFKTNDNDAPMVDEVQVFVK